MASPFTEALSTLNDRALRRLLGARAYLRGYDYVRRHAVEDVVVEDAGARGHVRGTDADPYKVTLQLTPSGFTSSCTCPAFASSNGGHCKHVAALLIALRDQARGAQRRAAPPAPAAANGVHYTVHGGTVHVAGVDGEGRRSKRARARAMKAAHQATQTARGFVPGGTGVDAWLPEAMPPTPKQIEYRLQVKGVGHAGGAGSGLTITLLNPENRVPLLPSALLVAQDQHPTADRDAIRLLARFENQGPRRVGIDVRGEDASDLLPLLKGRRVIVEPQMMELRFGDEPLRPRFDLELSSDGGQIVVRTAFQRQGDPRRFTTTSGAWFEGSPGWYVDAQEGWARPIDRRVSPAAVRRLLRLPVITEPVDRLAELVMHGLPKVALEVGAELPELSQVADVVDLEPTFRVAAGGTLVEAQVSLRAAYEDVEIDVRADGMTLPVIVKAPPPAPAAAPERPFQPARPGRGSLATGEVHPLRHRRAASRGRQAARPRPGARRGRKQVHRARRRRDPVLDRRHRDAARSVGHLRARTTSSTCTCVTRRSRRTPASAAASTGCRCASISRAKASR